MNTLLDFKKNTEKIFELAKKQNLNGREIALLIAINDLSDNEINSCFASNDTLGKMINLSPNRISYVLKCLAQKGLIILQYVPKGQNVTINGKNYVNYRLIKLNLSLTGNSNIPLSKTVTNDTKSKTTKNNKTNNLSSKTMDKPSKRSKKVKVKKIVKRDKTHTELFNYAMKLIKGKKSIGNKKTYAFTIVKNRLKTGLNVSYL